MTTTETIEGIVTSTNERGIRIGEDWFNVSKFKPVQLPELGVHVRVAVDPKGFLSSVQILEFAPSAKTPAVSSRNETITRLAVLKAAAGFVGALSQTRDDVKSDHVLLLAEKWLAWVNEEGS